MCNAPLELKKQMATTALTFRVAATSKTATTTVKWSLLVGRKATTTATAATTNGGHNIISNV
jgi:hypothetical protein